MQSYEEFLNSHPFYAYLTLTLTQFELRILLVDHKQTTFTTYDFAIFIASFD